MTETLIDEYISKLPRDTQLVLQKIRKLAHTELPDAVETISYGIPAFKLHGKSVIYFAGWKSHISIYPINNIRGALAKELAPYVTGKGTAQFKLDTPIPYELIKKVVRQRLEQIT